MKFSLDLISCQTFMTENLSAAMGISDCQNQHRLSHIPPIERRRLDQGAKAIFTLIDDCHSPIVFSSFQGEVNRCFKMYESLKQDNLISPTAFSLSVLNAIPALCAILFKNSKEILAVSQKMSLEHGLLNAYLLLEERKEEECLVIAYSEVENFVAPNSLAVISMRVKRGSKVELRLLDEEAESNDTHDSLATFLQNYGSRNQWLSYGDGERWGWHVLS